MTLTVLNVLSSVSSSSFSSDFLNRSVLDAFWSNGLINLVLLFRSYGLQNLWYQIPAKHQFFFLSYFSNLFNFFLDAQICVIVTVAKLSLYQSHVNCRSRNLEGNLKHKVNYRYYCHFQAWNLCSYLKDLEGLHSQGQGDGSVVRITHFLENYIGASD